MTLELRLNSQLIAILDGEKVSAQMACRLAQDIAIYPVTTSSTIAESAKKWKAGQGTEKEWKTVRGAGALFACSRSGEGVVGSLHGVQQGAQQLFRQTGTGRTALRTSPGPPTYYFAIGGLLPRGAANERTEDAISGQIKDGIKTTYDRRAGMVRQRLAAVHVSPAHLQPGTASEYAEHGAATFELLSTPPPQAVNFACNVREEMAAGRGIGCH